MSINQDLPDPAPVPADTAGEVELRDGVAYYRGKKPFEELELPPIPADVEEDYNWADRDPQVRKEYAGRVVAVRRRKVWGAGKSYRAAREAALKAPGCPPPAELVYVLVLGPGPAPPARDR